MNAEAYDELVSLIYECVLDESAWLRLLGRLAMLTGRREGSLLFWDHTSRVPPKLISLCSEASLLGYEHYFAVDPTQQFTTKRQVGSWYHDTEEYGLPNIRRDPFYQEFMRDHGQQSISCLKLHEQGNSGAYLSLLTALDAPLPGEPAQLILRRLSMHLTQAAQMSSRIQQLELDVTHRQLLLEQSPTAQWLVDAEGRTVFCNAAAEQRMSDPAFPLRERQGRLVAGSQGALSGVLRAVCGKAGACRAGWLRLPELDGELLVTPLRSESRLQLDIGRPLALVALLSGQPRAGLLADLFSCTPAEVRLAELIAHGLRPEDCAARLGVSINTVRSQLRALFSKTGTQRQAELSVVLARLGG